MDSDDQRIREAVERTEILRAPKQNLYTFGTTNIYYYLVTEPTYSELVEDRRVETVIREGRVVAERPKIVTPYYLSSLEGFSTDARKYLDALIDAHGPNTPGLLYTYKREHKDLNIVSSDLRSVVEELNARIDRGGDPMSAIIKGQDDLWDVSLVKFIFEMTHRSLSGNLGQMSARGLLEVDRGGIPADARIRIEGLFRQVSRGETPASELKDELDRWNLFEEYEDRFLNIFRK